MIGSGSDLDFLPQRHIHCGKTKNTQNKNKKLYKKLFIKPTEYKYQHFQICFAKKKKINCGKGRYIKETLNHSD